MSPSIKKVIAKPDHLLVIDFENGEQGTLDMKPYLNFGVFKKLQDQNEFEQVRVAFDTIEWPSGADLDPEFVYNKATRVVQVAT